MDLKQIIAGVVIGAILGIAGTFFILGQRIAKLEAQVEQLTKIRPESEVPELQSEEQRSAVVNIVSIADQNGNEITRNSVPFIISVEGTVANAKSLYLYLVVNDGNAEWIQPGLGANMDKSFSGNCYLGEIQSSESLNKWYRILAVVTNTSHNKYDHLKRETVVAQSDVIKLYRTH